MPAPFFIVFNVSLLVGWGGVGWGGVGRGALRAALLGPRTAACGKPLGGLAGAVRFVLASPQAAAGEPAEAVGGAGRRRRRRGRRLVRRWHARLGQRLFSPPRRRCHAGRALAAQRVGGMPAQWAYRVAGPAWCLARYPNLPRRHCLCGGLASNAAGTRCINLRARAASRIVISQNFFAP